VNWLTERAEPTIGINTYHEASVGSLLSIAALILYKGGEFLSRIILAHMFLPRDFGVVTFSLAFMFMAQAIILMGLEKGVIRYIAYYRGTSENGKAAESALAGGLMVFISGVAISLLLYIIAPIFSRGFKLGKEFYGVIGVICLMLVPNAVSYIVRGILSGLKKMQYVALISAVEKAILVIVLLGIYFAGSKQISTALSAYIFAPLGTTLLGICFISGNMTFESISPRGILLRARELFGYSWRLAFGTLLNTMRLQGELLILGYFLAPGTLGGYSAASLIAGIMLLPVYGSENIIIAVSSELFANKLIDQIRGLYRMVALWLFFFACVIFGAVLVDPAKILELFFAQSYSEYSLVLSILAFASFLNLMSGTQGALNLAFGHTKVILALSLVGIVTNIGLNILLVPLCGAVGAAWARIIALILSEGIGLAAIYRYHRIQPFQRAHIAISTLSFAAWAVIWIAREEFSLAWPVSISLYATLVTISVFLARILPPENMLSVVQWVKKKVSGSKIQTEKHNMGRRCDESL